MAAPPRRSGPAATAPSYGARRRCSARALLPTLAASTAITASGGTDHRSREALVAVALRGQAGAAGHLARARTREWLPLPLTAATVSRRARRMLPAAAIVDSLPTWAAAARSGNPADVTGATALHALDPVAYAAGMWREMARSRDFRALAIAGARSSSDTPQ